MWDYTAHDIKYNMSHVIPEWRIYTNWSVAYRLNPMRITFKYVDYMWKKYLSHFLNLKSSYLSST